jgi:hypothetical protein
MELVAGSAWQVQIAVKIFCHGTLPKILGKTAD